MKIQLENGEFQEVPDPKFEEGEFVKTSSKHYSPKDFGQLGKRLWTKERGWVYEERFIDRDGSRGGTCFHNDEDLFDKLDNPKDILIAQKLTRKERINELHKTLDKEKQELEKIEFVLSLIK